MLSDAGIVDPQEHETAVISSFLESQMNPAVVWELKDLVFVEFMETLSRLALKVIDSYRYEALEFSDLVMAVNDVLLIVVVWMYSTLTDAKRIRMVFNIIAGLYREEKPSHK